MRCSCVAVLCCGVICAFGAEPSKEIATKEIPKSWKIEEIVDAMPPRSDDGPMHVLAWKVIKDDRPLRVDYCLAIKQLKKPPKEGHRWVIASLARNSAESKDWEFVTVWLTPDPDFKNPPFIMHVQKYENKPTNNDIHKFMDEFEWKLGADRDFKLVDGGICAAWEKTIGEKPVRTFEN